VQIFDVKRLLIQEKGEEDYEYIYSTKKQRLLDVIEDDFKRHELTLDMEHFQIHDEKLKSRADYRRLV
jgi:hypothetical protein